MTQLLEFQFFFTDIEQVWTSERSTNAFGTNINTIMKR